jgi:imidazolonepropionase-like amidohydrolase
MKLFITTLVFLVAAVTGMAQETVYPAKAQKAPFYIKDGQVHIGNGQVLDKATIEVVDGKITNIGSSVTIPAGATVIDAVGKQVYPGLILSSANLGLVEVGSVRATVDAEEIGEYNPSVRSIAAYNTDSKVINTLKSNGILLANIVPGGAIISGSSSIVQLDAWNWEDAAYKMDNGIHYNFPALMARQGRYGDFGGMGGRGEDPIKKGLEQLEKDKAFFKEAKAYSLNPSPKEINLKFEALKGLFNGKQKLFVHCDIVRELLLAMDFKKELGLDVVIVGGSESYQVADLLKKNEIPVILSQLHNLPTLADDAVDQPFKTPAQLQKAGVLFALNDEDGQHRGKNLPFNAGTSVAYGLTKEQALCAITLNAAKILGIADKTGSLEVGKDANIVISAGDILDMRSSKVVSAFIQGRNVDLTDKHKQLYERYKYKYGIK